MSQTPRVSVIMITYNQERYVEQAVRSVLAQHTAFDFEIVIADDASTDSTPAVLSRLREENPQRINLILRESNIGAAPNYLDAWSRCRAPYIAICEGDDRWMSRRKLARQVKWMDAHPECTVCFHRVANYYQENSTWTLSTAAAKADMTLEDLSRSNIITNLSVMYRAIPRADIPAWVAETPLFDYAMHSLHAARGAIRYLPHTMAVYRRHSAGIWSGDRLRALRLAVEIRRRLMAHFAGSRPEAVANWLDMFVRNSTTLGALQLAAGDDTAAASTADDIARTTALYSNSPIGYDKALQGIRDADPGAGARRPGRLRALTRLIPLRIGATLLDRAGAIVKIGG
ncbi:MAG: glycosyltransferase [Paramuribaculum sp.]|nr:glycosyltransferase [Paramuribaculum sp.]